MIYVLTYDLEHDRTRTRLAKYLEKISFVRIQFSVFIAEMDHTVLKKHLIKIENIISKSPDNTRINVFILPVSKDLIEESIMIGVAQDWNKVFFREHTIFV